MNYLMQNTDIDDVEEVVEDALEIINETVVSGLATTPLIMSALNEAVFNILRITIEEYLEEFGFEIKINTYQDITSEILEVTGVRIPYISEFFAEDLFKARMICFERCDGSIINDPQIPLIGGWKWSVHNPLIVKPF